jgi:hypothetical protein
VAISNWHLSQWSLMCHALQFCQAAAAAAAMNLRGCMFVEVLQRSYGQQQNQQGSHMTES